MDVQEEVKDLTITEGRIGKVLLEKYDPKQFHVIVPTHVITIPEEVMELEVSVVKISPNPKDLMVYPFPEAGAGMVGLAKRGIEAISNAAGLKDEGDQEIAFVPGQYAIVKATVSATLPNGEVIPRTRSKSIDVEARMEEYEFALRERIEQGNEKGFRKQGKNESDEAFHIRVEGYVQKKCTKRRHHLRKFMWELANTGAHLRAMQALLPSLKPVYHYTELKKPFVIPRISVKPAVTQNRLLAEAIRARAERDLNLLFPPDKDEYEGLPPALAEKIRERDRILAELADDFDNGLLLEEGAQLVEATTLAKDLDGWELLQEAYRSNVKEEEEEAQHNSVWPRRPWDAETLKRYLNEVKVPAYSGQDEEPSPEQQDFVRSALSKLSGDDAEQSVIISYLFDAKSIADLTAAQCVTLSSWIGTKPPDYEPSPAAVEEAKAIIQHYQVD